jgi:hypothetical protein
LPEAEQETDFFPNLGASFSGRERQSWPGNEEGEMDQYPLFHNPNLYACTNPCLIIMSILGDIRITQSSELLFLRRE